MIDFPAPSQRLISRWLAVAEKIGIPEQAYNPEVRVISDTSGKSDYTFGAILNENRSRRPLDALMNRRDCPLCGAIEDAKQDPIRNLDPDSGPEGHIVIANIFPAKLGHSMVVSEETGDAERPMYNTRKLSGVAEELNEMFTYAGKVRFQVFHNGIGAGASIPNHQHAHLTNWHATFSKVDKVYGFESAETRNIGTRKVREMSNFPFAHVIFPQNDPARIVDFLGKLGEALCERYDSGTVPHVLCQGRAGILVAPYKVPKEKGGIGSGDVAGHIVFKDRPEFESATYDTCIQKLGSQLFEREEIDLTKLL